MTNAPLEAQTAFAREVTRVRASGQLGVRGRLAELFDFLAARGADATAATQEEIAQSVFGQSLADADDATVRVYVHRLRKRLDTFYDSQTDGQAARLTLPAGSYALRIHVPGAEAQAAAPAPPRQRVGRWRLALVLLLALVAGFLGAWLLGLAETRARANAIWRPFSGSERPILLLVGDYYLLGEIDPYRPEDGRLIRDFQVNSREDLMRMQSMAPERYGRAEDVGLNYLPFAVAFGLRELMPVLAGADKPVTVLAASEFRPEMLNQYDVIYVGLLSGLSLLEETTFTQSNLRIGETYDELIETRSGKRLTSEGALRRTSAVQYRDYGLIARYRSVSGARVLVLAGTRDTGLRGVAPLVRAADLPDELRTLADAGDFEALFRITGQQGSSLSQQLVLARARPASR